MTQKFLCIAITFIVFNLCCSYGQSGVKTIELKKGEVFDMLLLQQNPGKEEAFKSYFQTAGAVAKKMSYRPLGGLKIKAHLQGNLQPSVLVFAKWDDMVKRESFLNQITEEVPDFHERRRELWPYFGLRYYEVKKDLSLKINREKYLIATAYWLNTEDEVSNFYGEWKSKIQSANGEVLVELKDGKSPFGYRYDPDFFVITSWQSESDFKAFQKSVQNSEMDNIQHINEFILE
ncbi:MAG: hypothetical protein AAGL29_04875 [Bacteroidota bacterium]